MRLQTLLLLVVTAAAPAAAQAPSDAAAASTASPSDNPPASTVVLRASLATSVWRPTLPNDARLVVLTAPSRSSEVPHRTAVVGAVLGGAMGLYFPLVLMESSDELHAVIPFAALYTVGGTIIGGVVGHGLGKFYVITHRRRYVEDPARRHPYGMDEPHPSSSMPSAAGLVPPDSTPAASAATPAASAVPAGV